MSLLPKTFHIDLPDDLVREVEKCKDDDAVKQVGIEWCVQQSKELMEHKIPCLHYYTMGNAEIIRKIASQVY
jgi:methylenetetrahydrofolate reductase (NADPH)